MQLRYTIAVRHHFWITIGTMLAVLALHSQLTPQCMQTSRPTLWDYPRVSQFCCSFVFLYPLPYLFVKCPLFFRCCTNRYADQDLDVVTGWEIVFGVCAAAFVLEEYTAATEHGWSIYIANVSISSS